MGSEPQIYIIFLAIHFQKALFYSISKRLKVFGSVCQPFGIVDEMSYLCGMNRLLIFLLAICLAFSAPDTGKASVANDSATVEMSADPVKKKGNEPPVKHSAVGDRSVSGSDSLRLEVIGRRQGFSGMDKSTYDNSIFSPKSAQFSKDGSKLYVNSLEGCHTTVYSAPSLRRLSLIEYEFPSGVGAKWAKPSGYYLFSHYSDGEKRGFAGKPVEGTFSHGGRYLWVTFYRRSFDLNAQDPSAVAVIDMRTDSIVRMFETGPLPKMIAVSPDSKRIAVTHWGDNTIGLIDISSPDMKDWRHLPPIEIGRKLKLDYPLNKSVNRDANSGNLLRGTVFTPDGKWLLVSGMSGPLQIIDMEKGVVVGHSNEVYGLRHLAIYNGYVYGSHNVNGIVYRFSLDALIEDAVRARSEGRKSIKAGKVESCKVGKGARTLVVSPDGRYLFVACNSESALHVVDARTMKVVDSLTIDSYPVGLAISPDGTLLAVTSQGREGHGGNALNLVRVISPYYPVEVPAMNDPTEIGIDEKSESHQDFVSAEVSHEKESGISDILTPRTVLLIAGILLALILALLLYIRARKRHA